MRKGPNPSEQGDPRPFFTAATFLFAGDEDELDDFIDEDEEEEKPKGKGGKGKGKAAAAGKGKAAPSSAGAKRKRGPAAASSAPSSSSAKASSSAMDVEADTDAEAEGAEEGGAGGAGQAAAAAPGGSRVLPRGAHKHNSFPFLKPENLRDASGRRPDHPEFDPRTLSVPSQFMKEVTPAMHQWWQFKVANMDTLLLFKMGKVRA